MARINRWVSFLLSKISIQAGIFIPRRFFMGEEKLKKMLAGLGIAALVSAAGVSLPPPANAASG
jgi:radical SAM modification target selenobiotic family peptide